MQLAHIQGMAVDILAEMQTALNVTFSLRKRLHTSWDKMIESLGRGEAEFCGTSHSNLEYRHELFIDTHNFKPKFRHKTADFLPGYARDTPVLYIDKRDEKAMAYFGALLAPFDAKMWAAIFAISALCGIILSTLHRPDDSSAFISQALESFAMALFASLSVNILSLTHQNWHTSIAIKMFVFAIFLTGTVLFMGFKASLTTLFSIQMYEMPFNSWEGLNDEEYM